MKPTTEINQLKSKLEEFEHTNRVYETGFVKGLFYSITLLEHGLQEAEAKLNSDKIRDRKIQVDELLEKSISALNNPNISVEGLSEIKNNLLKVQEELFI